MNESKLPFHQSPSVHAGAWGFPKTWDPLLRILSIFAGAGTLVLFQIQRSCKATGTASAPQRTTSPVDSVATKLEGGSAACDGGPRLSEKPETKDQG